MAALLATIVRAARDAMNAAHARLVLRDCATWRTLLPGAHDADAAAGTVAAGYDKRVTATLQVLEGGAVELAWQHLRTSGPIARAIETEQPIFIPDLQADVGYGPHSARLEQGFRSIAVVPLTGAGGRVRGTLSASFVKMIGEAAEDAAAKVARLQRIVRLSEDVSPLGPSKPLLNMERSTG